MKNEKIMILEMVKEGTITVDDGVKLLNALSKTNQNFEDFAKDLKYKINNIPKPNANKIKQNAQIFFDKTEDIFDEMAKNIKGFFEPVDTTQNEQTNYDVNPNVQNLNNQQNISQNDSQNNIQ